jgi:hypothetical protein
MNLTDFSPTKPTTEQLETIEAINREYSHLAEGTVLNVPSSAHRNRALRLLLESKMTLIHGVTHPNDLSIFEEGRR